jgi:hypothetical protein
VNPKKLLEFAEEAFSNAGPEAGTTLSESGFAGFKDFQDFWGRHEPS